tara:strand:+ start:2446 stop:2613 length:168 start_codon:yes stop_codon:yes gene_type:complete
MSAWSIKQKKIKKQHEKEEAKTKLEALFKRDISPPVDEKQNDNVKDSSKDTPTKE